MPSPAAGDDASGGSEASAPPDASVPTTPTTAPATPTTPGASGSQTLATLDFEDGQLGTWTLVKGSDGARAAAVSQVVSDVHARGSKAFKVVADQAVDAATSATDGTYLRQDRLWPLSPNKFYLRFFLRLSQALGDGHIALVEARGKGSGQGALTAVRMGGQFGMLVANLEATDGNRSSGGNSFAGDPRNAPGVKLAANTWYCMEILFDTVQPALRVWLDDRAIDNLTVTQNADWTSPPAAGARWMPNISEIELGWRGYNGQGNTVFFDDIVVARERVGCSP